jgi:hexosaminidase
MATVAHRASIFAVCVIVLAIGIHGCAPRETSTPSTASNKLLATVPPRCVAAGEPLPVIPLPRRVTRFAGSFTLPSRVTISAEDPTAQRVASLLASALGSLGTPALVNASDSREPTIRLVTARGRMAYGREGYRLLVGTRGIIITANSGAGLFYGVQTLEQLASLNGRDLCSIPDVDIADWPQYRWRGLHLDTSRHFFPIEIVERFIDTAARFKLNTFHWHLTDDQGWRIDIRAFPNLARIGGCRDGTQVGGFLSGRSDGIRTCDYYSQAAIRDVVAYAAGRYVTVIPEIEGPGHSVEAMAAYPFLACAPGSFSTQWLWGSPNYALCPTEHTFAFFDEVMHEVANLFPGPFIHIGGDEVSPHSWRTSPYVGELMRRENLSTYAAVQGYFTRRIEAIVRRYRRRVVGWDEIVNGGVSRDATVMAWNGSAAAADAAEHGNDVVMTPQSPLYFDAVQGPPRLEPPAIAMVYAYDPTPATLSISEQSKVIGAQANVWTEYIPNASHLWYMVYPRALALAELCWTPRTRMNWESFVRRLGPALARLEASGITFRIPEVSYEVRSGGAWLTTSEGAISQMWVLPNGSPVTVDLRTLVPDATIHYTLDGSDPTESSAICKRALRLVVSTTAPVRIAAIAVLKDRRKSVPSFLSLVR